MNQLVPTFKLAVAQAMTFPGDVSGNIDRMEPLIDQAAAQGARLILFGECNVTGLSPDAVTVAASVREEDAGFRRLQVLARRYGIAVVAGYLERTSENKVRNTQAVFFPDGRPPVLQHKARVFRDEQGIANFQAGVEGFETFMIDHVRCAITICGDSGIPGRWNALASAGVQLHLQPTAGCGPRSWGYAEAELDDPARMTSYLKHAASVVFSEDAIRKARGHRIVMASANQMADDGVGYFHPGHSMIVDTTGELSALIPGSFVFEHLHPRVACAVVHPQTPRTSEG